MKTKLAVALIGLLLVGCATVPSTKVAINPNTGVVILDSPKEITISNLTAHLPNGTEVLLSGYSSKNSPEVLATVAAANAAMADKLLQLTDKLIQLGKEGAIKAGSGGLAP